MVGIKRALVSNDVFELPHNRVISILIGVIHDLVVRHDFLIIIVIDGALELDIEWMLLDMVLMILNFLNNLDMLDLITVSLHIE